MKPNVLYIDKVGQVCIWNELMLTSNENNAIINNSAINYPTCNIQFPEYLTDFNESNKWADCIYNKVLESHLILFSQNYNNLISLPIHKLVVYHVIYNKE